MQDNGYERDMKYKLASMPQNKKMSEESKQRILQALILEEKKMKRERNWTPLKAKVKWATLTLAAGMILVVGAISLKDQIKSPETGVTQGTQQTGNPLANISTDDLQGVTVIDGTDGDKSTIKDASRVKNIFITLRDAHPKLSNTKEIKGYLYRFDFQTNNGLVGVTFLGDKIEVNNKYYLLDSDVTQAIQSIVQNDQGKGTIKDNQNTETNKPTTTNLVMGKAVKIQMIDLDKGWVQSDQGIAFTNDGGSHWNSVTPQVGLTSSLVPKMAVYGNHAWIALYNGDKASIYRSTDKGQHWTNTTFKTEQPMQGVISIQFTDASHGYLLLSGDMATGNQFVGIYQTTDGGANWSFVSAADPTHPGGAPYSGMKNGLYFKNNKIGWITGLDASDQPYLYQTTDGGKSWKQQLLAIPDGYTAEGGSSMTYSPIFFNDNDGILPVRFGGQLHPYVFYSTHNGGATWEASGGSIQTSDSNNFDMNDWQFINSKDGFATSGKQLFVTKDGGNHWSTITLNQGLDKISFVTPQTGYGMSNGQLLKTTDGGKTWKLVTTFK